MLPDIEKKYTEEEYMRTPEPYVMYLRALEKFFDFSIVDSFADLGCSSGRLIEHMKLKYPHVEVFGFEYFEWAKKNRAMFGVIGLPTESFMPWVSARPG
jgi:tRNA G46 methylase TrmB